MLKKAIIKLIKTPLTYLFVGIYSGAVLLKGNYTGSIDTEPILTFLLFGCILTTVMFLISKSAVKNQIAVKEKSREALLSAAYFFCWLLLFMLLGKYLLANFYLSNGFGFWVLLVLLPGAYLWLKGYRLPDFGLTQKHFSQNLRITFLACLVMCGILLLLTPGGKYIVNNSLSFKALLISFSISFGYAFLFAGFFEEFFFRAILQTRFTQYFNSDIKGILLASIIFGLFHLPFQYYNEGAANGEFLYALSNVLTEQMISAPIFGILWARTHNLMAPVLLHSLIDTISLMPQILEKYNL